MRWKKVHGFLSLHDSDHLVSLHLEISNFSSTNSDCKSTYVHKSLMNSYVSSYKLIVKHSTPLSQNIWRVSDVHDTIRISELKVYCFLLAVNFDTGKTIPIWIYVLCFKSINKSRIPFLAGLWDQMVGIPMLFNLMNEVGKNFWRSSFLTVFTMLNRTGPRIDPLGSSLDTPCWDSLPVITTL